MSPRMTRPAIAAWLRCRRRQASLHRLRPAIGAAPARSVTSPRSVIGPGPSFAPDLHLPRTFICPGPSFAGADAWIERAVEQIDREIAEYDQHAIEHHRAHHQRVVAI